MSRFTWILLAFVLLGAVVLGADKPDQKAAESGTAIEFSKLLPKANFRGTVGYGRTEQEAPFLARVTEEPINLWAGIQMPPAQGEKPDPKKEAADKAERENELRKTNAYRLAEQAGKYVGWFGIVRGVSRNQPEGRTDLLVEHKYFDGLGDPDMQIVSVYGAGDFTASLRAEADKIPMLSLVRVYGKVSMAKDGTPRIEADYVRVWDWGLFTFMDYGPDHTNPKWLALRKLAGSEVYNPRPTTEFYQQVLGKREDPKATESPAKQ